MREVPGFVRTAARRIVEICDPLAVVLFGSWAHGRANRHSDLDLLVILAARPAPVVVAELTDAMRCIPLKVDLLTWTPAELAAAASDRAGFAGTILSGAVVLHRRVDAPDRVAELLPDPHRESNLGIPGRT